MNKRTMLNHLLEDAESAFKKQYAGLLVEAQYRVLIMGMIDAALSDMEKNDEERS